MMASNRLALVASLQFGIAGDFDCHVFGLRGADGIVLIDSGAGTHTGTILDNLQHAFGSNTLRAVVITHGHLDHCGGVASLHAQTGCRVIAPLLTRKILESADEEASNLRLGREQGIYPPDLCLRNCPVDLTLQDGDQFEAAGLEFTALNIRGHSPDSFCFLVQVDGAKWLFSGDSVFYGGILGVINVPGSDMGGYREDLHKLHGLGIDGLFPGHGMFTLRRGQEHIDLAIAQTKRGFVPRQIGQGDLIF